MRIRFHIDFVTATLSASDVKAEAATYWPSSYLLFGGFGATVL